MTGELLISIPIDVIASYFVMIFLFWFIPDFIIPSLSDNNIIKKLIKTEVGYISYIFIGMCIIIAIIIGVPCLLQFLSK